MHDCSISKFGMCVLVVKDCLVQHLVCIQEVLLGISVECHLVAHVDRDLAVLGDSDHRVACNVGEVYLVSLLELYLLASQHEAEALCRCARHRCCQQQREEYEPDVSHCIVILKFILPALTTAMPV